MMPTWEASTLGQLCKGDGGTIQTGPFGSQLHRSDYLPSGVPVIMPTNIQKGRIDLDGIAFISETDADRLGRHRVRRGDVIFSRRGEVDKCAVITDREAGWLCGTGCLLARVNAQKADPEFIGHHINFEATRLWLRQHAVGLVMPNLNTGILNYIPLCAPPLSAQRSIASVLSALDDKIELNRRMNETLEASARALFRDWFVDFGPTRAKAEGRPAYLAADLWSLFPDRLGDDRVPEGWRTYTIGDLAEHHTASTNPNAAADELFEHYSLPAFDAGGSPALDTGDSIKSNKTLVPDGAVLLSKLNPEISRVWVPNDRAGMRQVASTEFLAFVPKAPASRGMLFALFRDDAFRQTMEGMVTGTSKSHQRISPPALRAVQALAGSPPIFEAFEQPMAPVVERLLSNRTEIRSLAATRDALLPKLLSGEIRVREAEALAA